LLIAIAMDNNSSPIVTELVIFAVIAALFAGLYFYFKKLNSTYVHMTDQQLSCITDNPNWDCTLVKGGQHVSDEGACQAACDKLKDCNAYSFKRGAVSGSEPNCWLKYQYPVQAANVENKAGYDFGYKHTPSPDPGSM
jgi:hypothetical protein